MAWNIDELTDRLTDLVRAGDTAGLQALVAEIAPQDVAHAARHLSEEDAADLLKRLPDEYSADVLVEFREDTREDVMELLTASEIADVVEMDSDDAADVLSELEDSRADEVVSLLEEDDRREITQLLAYPEDTAGGIMQLEVVSVRNDRTVQRATEKIRLAFADVKTDFYFVYVVDRAGKLVGRVPLPRLILAAPEDLIENIMERETYAVDAEIDQEEVARNFRKYNQPSAPVVDREGILLGRITHDDVADVILEEAEEDYSRLAGTHDDDLIEDSRIYRKAGIRLPWLITGLVGGLLSAVVLSHFEAEIEKVIALAFFVPVIMAMGGNVAIQSSAVMVRSLALGDVSPREAMPRLFREVGVSVITGVVCSTLIFLTSWAWFGDPMLGGVVAVSMLCVILISTSVGAIVPLTLERFKIDPALATGPFVTTSNDILGILIYLMLATRFLN